MMGIVYRNFEDQGDLTRQYEFWESMTSSLPYAWKPTHSPKHFSLQKEFHPKTRCFAYDGDALVGYMSFTGKGSFVSLGYPWVLPEYRDIQDELFDRVYGFASSNEYGGKQFAQRFRSQWQEPIDYFLSKGFMISNSSPIIGKELNDEGSTFKATIDYKLEGQFDFEKWKRLKRKDSTNEELQMMSEYYSSVEFDFAISFYNRDQLKGYCGIAIRKKTGFAEINAIALDNSCSLAEVTNMLEVIEFETFIREGKVVSLYQSSLPTGAYEGLKDYHLITEDVMMVKGLNQQ
ncbi:hypothetical protein JOC86_004447 [Bacillus pakistanensis]|uniref:N-acetyltransferase domain-containing protein n=2 Tax=Rossellomorea pakistanensis TaxID=992288 RepID=A0ABS2NJ34_9BACI|nr:hypothetical protein [Bacillus pakistanensis]